jgi:SNF2-related domain/Bromodomain
MADRTPSNSLSHGRESLQDRTVGYLVVEDCELYMSEDHEPSRIQNVRIPLSLHEGMLKLADTKNEKVQSVGPCQHCYLVLEKIQDGGDEEENQQKDHGSITSCSKNKSKSKRPPPPTLQFAGISPRFDGTIHDTKSKKKKQCQCSNHSQRSDAALLVGTALAAHDLGHIKVQSIQVYQTDENENISSPNSQEDDDDDNAPRAIGNFIKRRAAAVLITFSVHEIIRKPPPSVSSVITESTDSSVKIEAMKTKHKPVILQGSKRRFLSNSSKDLPPSTQLLLSLTSSDWGRLKMKIHRWTTANGRSDSRKSISERSSLFPSQLSLSSVYRRIGGASCSSVYVLDRNKDTTSGDGSLSLSRLPPDVLSHHIGPFLKARSIDALRCTCTRLHHTMRAVVPGLKLKLFDHQIKSLYWMRMRETKSISESDLTKDTTISNLRNDNNDGDLHRAASGGASVALTPRPRRQQGQLNSRPAVVRVCQRTGEEMNVHEKDVLSRSLARGGLLCDDPGLGKTITVLSLILQTMGLSTERKDDAAPLVKELTEEEVFEEYWYEQMIPEIRVQELTRLFQSFLRSSVEIFYFFDEVDKSIKGKIDFLHGVPDPICLKDIRTRIGSGYYSDGDSFAMFENDVGRVFSNAMQYTAPDSIWYLAAERLAGRFDGCVREFKKAKARIAKKSFGSPNAKPNSSVAALVEEANKAQLYKSLISSKSTLLVVPSVLIDHWHVSVSL